MMQTENYSDHYVFSLRIPFIKITIQTIDKRAVTKRCSWKITEGQWAVLNFVSDCVYLNIYL